MTVADMLAQISEHGFGDVSTAEQLRAINASLWDIIGREPWPFREKTLALNFNGSSPTPTNWPSDFRAVKWISDQTTGDSVFHERLETIRSQFQGNLTTVSDPAIAYYFVGYTPYFYPIPAASTGRYVLDYVARQPILTSGSVEADILIPLEYHRVIVLGALIKLYLMDDDVEEAPLFKAEYDELYLNMREELLRRQYQRPDQIFAIDEDDEWSPYLLP